MTITARTAPAFPLEALTADDRRAIRAEDVERIAATIRRAHPAGSHAAWQSPTAPARGAPAIIPRPYAARAQAHARAARARDIRDALTLAAYLLCAGVVIVCAWLVALIMWGVATP